MKGDPEYNEAWEYLKEITKVIYLKVGGKHKMEDYGLWLWTKLLLLVILLNMIFMGYNLANISELRECRETLEGM